MYAVLTSLLSQIVCLISLCWSSDEHLYLLWYIPNWISSTLVILPLIDNYNKTIPSYLKGLYLILFLINLVITVLYLERHWVLACPALVSTLTVYSVDYYDPLIVKKTI